MKACRKLGIFMAVLLLLLVITPPASAAKPEKTDCGVLLISTSGEDMQMCMAVCIAEEDGNFVYSGNHPIQQQFGLYVSFTASLDTNAYYEIEEDSEYEAIQGVYRFALKETQKKGKEADVFPEMAAVKKGETVYFVHLDENESSFFVTEKTTVKSVRGGVLTTEDALEKDSGNGDFSVIFNDSGNVVGFCKSGIATAPLSNNSGDLYVVWIAAAGLAVVIVIALLMKKKKGKQHSDFNEEDNRMPWADDESTTLDSDTILEDSGLFLGATLVLKCHGGYLNGRTYPIPSEGITIGREPDNSIRYPGQTPGISRHHVKLFWQNGQLMLLDVGSSNGTYVNQTGRVLTNHPVALNPGDIFYLGEKLNGFEISIK